MRNVSDKFAETDTHLLFYNFLFKNCAVYKIMWKYVAQPDRPQMTV
jgi:hypothetical protein